MRAMDALHLALIGLAFVTIFLYQGSKIQSLQKSLAEQNRAMEEVRRSVASESELAASLESKVSFWDTKLSNLRDFKAELSREYEGQIDQVVDTKLRSLKLDSQSKGAVPSSADGVQQVNRRVDAVEKRITELIADNQYVYQHALLLGTSNVCVFASTEKCPHNFAPASQFALGTFQAEGKLPAGFQDAGPFNDQGWKWMQGHVCCSQLNN